MSKLCRHLIIIGKAVTLAAEIRCAKRRCGCNDTHEGSREVVVTIGLFTIIKLCRLVDLTVESRGFCIPEECENVAPLTPCEFFDTLDFPFEMFSPPQRREFFSGNGNSSNGNGNNGNCQKKQCGCRQE